MLLPLHTKFLMRDLFSCDTARASGTAKTVSPDRTMTSICPRSVAEAKRAAALLKAHEIRFDHCFASVLKRAFQQTSPDYW